MSEPKKIEPVAWVAEGDLKDVQRLRKDFGHLCFIRRRNCGFLKQVPLYTAEVIHSAIEEVRKAGYERVEGFDWPAQEVAEDAVDAFADALAERLGGET